jgi:hypothetical protein
MLNSLSKRLTLANVALTLALVFAMTGGAYAAKKYLITSTKQISPSVLKSLQGKTGKTGPAGAQGPAGPAGSQGPAGKDGANGAAGKEGSAGAKGATGPSGPKGATGATGEPWTAGGTLPSKQTETGTWGYTVGAFGAKAENVHIPISFPIPLAAALGESGVHLIAPSGKELVVTEPEEFDEELTPTKCGSALTPAGSVEKPAATPGNLCVYISKFSGSLIEQFGTGSNFIVDPSQTCVGYKCLTQEGGPGGGASPTGAVLQVIYGEETYGYGTWAVTAP